MDAWLKGRSLAESFDAATLAALVGAHMRIIKVKALFDRSDQDR
jgi:hypothetical protein